jgi:hypothetical protein
MASSLSAAAHTGHASSSRASIPATAPPGAKVSARPRKSVERRHDARVMHEGVLGLRNGQLLQRLERRACARGPRGAGGSTTSMAWCSRQKRAAIMSVLMPTSVLATRAAECTGELKPSAACSAKIARCASSAEPITS